ncbi:DMT family transporter [Luteithermobacter gelatinilyticus]|uniref:DMT family transporter n=1 Tax=Luteithermobacter gelatinilyticus TaxID=2582913 RepID=UPI0011058851|nr:DMT family transporter [Luteithermobacter gelatinilyticus]
MSLRPNLLLTLAALIWGVGFVFQKEAMAHMGPFMFNGLRFLIGGGVLLPLIYLQRHKRQRYGTRLSRPLLRGAGLAGTIMFAAAALQQFGIVHTTVTNTGFITGLYMILVPVLGWFLGHRYRPGIWGAVLMACVGLYLLSGAGQVMPAYGDMLVFAGAVCWAAHVLTIDHLTTQYDQILIAMIQFMICGLLSCLAAFLAGETLPVTSAAAWTWILLSGILAVGIAFTLQVVGQAVAPPAQAAMLMNLEAVFAAAAGYMFFGEYLTPLALTGCALMLAGCVLAQRYPPLPAGHRA